MSDWGNVAFYYDYQRMNRHTKELEPCEGLVSKFYCNPEVTGMIKHAGNGIQYFWKRKEDKWVDFDFYRTVIQGGDYWNLNMAFDVFFQDEDIKFGKDGLHVLKDTMDTVELTRKEMRDELFNCEGSYGWLFMAYTENELKYGYSYKGSVVDFEKALEIEADHWHYNVEEMKKDPVIQETIQFFHENAKLVSHDEFWDLIEKCGNAFLDNNLEIIEDESYYLKTETNRIN